MNTERIYFKAGELYLFHKSNPACPAETSLWGLFDHNSDGRTIHLEAFTRDLDKYDLWSELPTGYIFCRLATRDELRDFTFNLASFVAKRPATTETGRITQIF